MKLAVLFSGGKDSCFAAYTVMKSEDVRCLITLFSDNPESYMFHTPNIGLTEMQANAMGLPLLKHRTRGNKEKELKDLEASIKTAMKKFEIEGIVTGAVQSIYQSSRIQKICDSLGIWCFNPLWQIDQLEYMKNFVSSGFRALISSVSAYPFDSSWLGREIDAKTINELSLLSQKYGISITGEGGEYETFVFDSPIFKKRIRITETSKSYEHYSGIFEIKNAVLEERC